MIQLNFALKKVIPECFRSSLFILTLFEKTSDTPFFITALIS